MKNAKYYIDLIFQSHHSEDEWKRIDKEVEEWVKNCSEAELDEFVESGAGETLYMICTGFDYMDTIKIIINDFYNLSIEFSKYIQKLVISESSIDKLMVYLMRLYVAAIELPDMEAETESNHDSKFCSNLSFSEGFETLYWSIFDPFNNNPEDEIVCMSLFDDLTTVLNTLQSGISEYEAGRIENAVFNWKFEFEEHTGTHIVNALKALHALKSK